MLLVLLYHQIADPTDPSSIKLFYQHLDYLAAETNIVAPGDKLDRNALNVCLTFDDAYFDFYEYVYPALMVRNIPAVLGIPVGWIEEDTKVAKDKRLAIRYPAIMEPNWQESNAPFCTWKELKEMCDSNLVIPASHAYYHLDLSLPELSIGDMTREVVESKNILERRLDKFVDTFIYPYGLVGKESQEMIRKHYQFDFRIGSAINKKWDANHTMYRVDAQPLVNKCSKITDNFLRKLKFKSWINYLRGK